MTENSELGDIQQSSSSSCELEHKGGQNSDQINRLQYTAMKSDSFTLDMDRFSHLTTEDVTTSINSRITYGKLQRSLSRKGSQRGGGGKKINSSNVTDNDNGRDANLVASLSSPKAALVGSSMPEKPLAVMVGAADHPLNQQLHHQITITTGNISTTTATTNTTAEGRLGGRRFSFKRSSSVAIDPRRILIFFATLSSMGTILLIYFTLSVGKLGEDDNTLDW